MTCKNCLYFNMCYVLADNPAEAEVEGAETDCSYFKDRSKYVVREKGEWTSLTECANAGVYCSVCNKKVWKEDYAWCNRKNKLRSNFCPNCGADMRKGENG